MWTPTPRREHSRDHLRYGSDLTDAEWEIIAPFLPPPSKTGTRLILSSSTRPAARYCLAVLPPPTATSLPPAACLGAAPRVAASSRQWSERTPAPARYQ